MPFSSTSANTVLLRRAADFALSAIQPVTPAMLRRPTPCAEWDLEKLLLHLCDSISALLEGRGDQVVAHPAGAPVPADDPLSACRVRVLRLRRSCERPGKGGPVVVGDLPLDSELLLAAGAVEVAVHAWDVSQACGARLPVPTDLAAALLPACLLIAPEDDRAPLFAEPRPAPPGAGPGDRLVSFLGRPVAGQARRCPR
ncbi:TIGR03086 family metal-binding protein [Actinomadura kijaniata]|uniref:TIGR03086 family metal-binding protein n=1 Tax=Actinomadura kijaniata TaxID=46161 RepID=UPI003F1A97E2